MSIIYKQMLLFLHKPELNGKVSLFCLTNSYF